MKLMFSLVYKYQTIVIFAVVIGVVFGKPGKETGERKNKHEQES